jgi:hypothetical protein
MPFAILTMLALTGCSSNEVPRAAVTGKVTYKGQMVPMGTVAFMGTGNVVETSQIQNGIYTIPRAPVGPVKITVITPVGGNPQQFKQKVEGHTMEGGAGGKVVAVPGKYSNPDESGLTYTVTAEPNQTHDLPLQ